MADLRSDFSAIGLREPQTYIQSGNVVFRTDLRRPATISKRITDYLLEHRGMETKAIVRSVATMVAAARENPFANSANAEKFVHLYFLDGKCSAPDRDKLVSLQSKSEHFELCEGVFYLHAPDGIGRSKLASNVERCLGVPTTARNLKTVNRLLAMASEIEDS